MVRLDIDTLAEIITQEIMKRIKNLEDVKPEVTVSVKASAGKRSVICFEDIRHMEACTLELERNAIITPLAKDFIKEKGIKIVYK